MSEDLGKTMLYVFFSTFQILIFIITGIIANKKKIITEKGRNSISSFVLNFLICFFVIFEISKVSSMRNFQKYYIILVITFTTITLRYFLVYLIMKVFQIDLKYEKSYCVGMAFSQIGSLSLVLGKNLCFKNGPLGDDPNCEDVLGIYILIQFVFVTTFFPTAFYCIMSDKNNYSILSNKIKYIYYRLLNKPNIPDYLSREIFHDFIYRENSNECFEIFNKNNKLVCDKNFNYKFINEISEEKHERNQGILKLFVNNTFQNVNCGKNSFIEDKNNCFNYKNKSSYNLNNNKYIQSYLNNSETCEVCTENLNEKNDVNDKFNRMQISSYFEKIRNEIKMINIEDIVILISKHLSQKLNFSLKEKINEILAFNKNGITKEDFSFLSSSIDSKNLHEIIILSNEIIVKNDELNKTIDKLITYEDFPIFFSYDSMKIDATLINEINCIWDEFELYVKNSNKNISTDVKLVVVDLKYLIGFLLNSTTISGIIGIFLGLSGIRDVIFSKNHYLSNFQSVFNMTSKAFVPLLFFNAGVSVSNNISFNVKISLNKSEYFRQHLISFFLAFVGLLVQLFWKNVFKQIVLESKMFQVATFIGWALPAFNPTLLLITNKCGKYFFKESSLLLKENLTYILVTVFIFLLIYFCIF